MNYKRTIFIIETKEKYGWEYYGKYSSKNLAEKEAKEIIGKTRIKKSVIKGESK